MPKPEMDPVESALIMIEDAEELVHSSFTKVTLGLARVVPTDGSKLRLPGDLTNALWRLYQLSPQGGDEGFARFLLALLPPRCRAVVTFDFYWDGEPCAKPLDIAIIPMPVKQP